MIAVTFNTDNLKVLEDAFYEFSTIDQRKIFISAFKKAAVPLVAMIKNNVAQEAIDKGNLYRSIGTTAVPNEVAIWVGSIRKTLYVTPKGKLSKVWYGLLTENGTKPRQVKSFLTTYAIKRGREDKRSLSPRGISATNWFKGAWEWGQYQVYEGIEKEWYESIERFINKTNAKMK